MPTATVTIMFTDLVGSTQMLSRLGEEAAGALRQQHFELLRTAVEARRGREVKNLGDGLMLAFESSADAVAAAVEVQRACLGRNRRSREPMEVRVGVAVGDTDVEAGDYFGVPVVQAARLCAAASGGEILATELVRALSGTRGGFDFQAVGDLELRGLDHPVPACRIRWEPEADARQPLPGRLAAATTDLFVGREPERTQLATAWKAVVSGERRMVLLAGEPGIGKTTLAAQLATEVHADGAIVAYGRCDEVGMPYQPWVESLGHIARGLPTDERRRALPGALGRLLPDLADGPPPVDADEGDAARYALFAAAVELVQRASDDRGLLLVIDDLHWVDAPSLQLLRYLVTAGDDLRIMVIGTFRDTDIGPRHPLTDLLADLHRERGVERIALSGFGDLELLALLERIAGHEMPAEGLAVRDAVLTETAGNPFFVLEILRHLADTGVLAQDLDGRWRDTADVRSAGLPVSVREVVGRRIGALGVETERTLGLAAVIGRDFDIALLAAVAERPEEAVIDCCDAAVRASVLETTADPERYTFAHALIEHTLYDGLSPARRSRAHRAVAERIEDRVGPDAAEHAGELAYHWDASAQPPAATKALHHALVAAARAGEQLAPTEALRWYAKACELLDQGAGDDRTRAETLVGLGIAQRQCGIADYRETLLRAADLADRVDAVDLLVRSAAANTREFSSIIGGIDAERVTVLERALTRIGGDDPAGRARLLVVLAMERTYRAPLDERLALIDEAIELARRSGDTHLLAQVLQRSCDAAIVPWTLQRRIDWATEAWALGQGRGDLEAVINARVDLMIAALEGGDLDTMRASAAEVDDLVHRIPQPALRWVASMHRAMLTVLAGDLDGAEREADAAYALAVETGQPDPLGVYGPQLLNIRVFQGRGTELLPLIESIVDSDLALPAHVAALALVRCWAGDLAGARALLASAHADGFAISEDQGWASAHVSWAETAARLREADAALVLHERLRPHAEHLVTTNVTVQPAVAHYLGLLDHSLGRLADAERWFERAMEIHRRMDSPLFVAATGAAWAALRAAEGDTHGARRLAGEALATASASGYGQVVADARAVLDQLG